MAVLAGLLLLPSLLVVSAPYLNSLDLRRYVPWPRPSAPGGWARWARKVMRWPWTSLELALIVLGLHGRCRPSGCSASASACRCSPNQASRGYAWELMARQFGPGETGPIFVLVQAPRAGGLWQPQILTGVLQLHTHLTADPRVARVQSLASIVPNPTARVDPVALAGHDPDQQRSQAHRRAAGEPGRRQQHDRADRLPAQDRDGSSRHAA